MYYTRNLSVSEQLYVSRAQQKIADLGHLVARELAINDVDYSKIQLIRELEYSIEVLKSTVLNWSKEDIQLMMDYYTVHGSLLVLGFRPMPPFPIYNGADGVWATIPQLLQTAQESLNRDNALGLELAQEIARLEALIEAAGSGGSGESAVLTTAITVQVNVGGVRIPKTYAIGTPLQSILADILGTPASVSNLVLSPEVETTREVGTDVVINSFSWSVLGSPANLKLSDNRGILVDVPVSGTGYIPSTPIVYPTPSNGSIIWTLSGSNIEPITFKTNAYYKSYYGKQATNANTPLVVTESTIAAGGSTLPLQDTSESITFSPNTSALEQAWIAVPTVQTGDDYTKWTVDSTNNSDIVIGEFIVPKFVVWVTGVSYSVYAWGYVSPLNKPITLHR